MALKIAHKLNEMESMSVAPVPLADIYKDDARESAVYYINPDDLDPEEERLTRIRLPPDEKFFPRVPSYKNNGKGIQADRVYVVGPSGSGKSYFMRGYARAFHEKYPEARVCLFSSKKEDRTLDLLRYIERVVIPEDIEEGTLTMDEFSTTRPCLMIFDDIEDFPKKSMGKEVNRFLSEVLRNGRDPWGIYAIYSHHDPCCFKETKVMLKEAKRIVFFPNAYPGKFTYLMSKYMGLNRTQIEQVEEMKSRWVCIADQRPRFILSDRYIILR